MIKGNLDFTPKIDVKYINFCISIFWFSGGRNFFGEHFEGVDRQKSRNFFEGELNFLLSSLRGSLKFHEGKYGKSALKSQLIFGPTRIFC